MQEEKGRTPSLEALVVEGEWVVAMGWASRRWTPPRVVAAEKERGERAGLGHGGTVGKVDKGASTTASFSASTAYGCCPVLSSRADTPGERNHHTWGCRLPFPQDLSCAGEAEEEAAPRVDGSVRDRQGVSSSSFVVVSSASSTSKKLSSERRTTSNRHGTSPAPAA